MVPDPNLLLNAVGICRNQAEVCPKHDGTGHQFQNFSHIQSTAVLGYIMPVKPLYQSVGIFRREGFADGT